MLRWTLPLLALIPLSTVATADDTCQAEDTAAPEIEESISQWADKVIIDTRQRALLFVWFDGQREQVLFDEVADLACDFVDVETQRLRGRG